MKAKILLTCGILFMAVNSMWSRRFESFSIGGGAGYSNYKSVTAEGFFQGRLSLLKRPFDVKAGISYLPCTSGFEGYNGLKTGSIGLFAEGVVYPVRRYLFAGVRWDVVTFNSLTGNALEQTGRTADSNIIFTGTNFYGVAGIDIPLGKVLNFKIYGLPGVRQYRISDGSFSSGDYVVNGQKQENHTEFIFRINMELAIKIKNRR
jgi:hypothetical protein